MLVLIAFVLGAAVGWWRARRRAGDRLDRLQYGAVHGIAFALAAVILLVIVQRLAVA